MQQTRACEQENAMLRARLADVDDGDGRNSDDLASGSRQSHSQSQSRAASPAGTDSGAGAALLDEDDDDDFGWVPPSASTKTTAWSVIQDRKSSPNDAAGGKARSAAAEVRRLERLLSEEKSAHRSSVRSLETQLLRMSSQLS